LLVTCARPNVPSERFTDRAFAGMIAFYLGAL
jgi:hypothetical protein